MTLLKDNNYKEINVALLSLEADIKNKITNLDTSVIDRQLAEINSRIDKINAGGNNSSASINDIRTEIEDINSKLNGNSAKIENIEQKLSDIFSAENKVTDFNTTTDSGIYYWVTDAANRPTDYGVLLVNKYYGGDSHSSLWVNQIAYGTNNKIYFRQNINSSNWTEWKAVAFEGEGRANFLDEYVGAGGTRLTSGNIVPKDSSEYGGMRKDVVSSSMTDSGRPGQDGHLLTMFWDSSGRWDSQLFVSNENPQTVKVRFKDDTADYGPWVDLITSNNIGSQTVAKAGNADAILDYNTGTPIKVRWDGPGIDSAEWYPAFNADGSLEPINRTNIDAGRSDRTTGIEYTGESDDCISAQQTPKSYNNSPADWASYIICNHGNGTTYYHQMLRLPFFSDAIQLQRRVNGELKGWKNVAIIENENTWSGRQNFDTAKASSKMVIPIGAPSSLEDGCIWIER